MDAADGSAPSSAMIALLPISSDWCKLDLPHTTLVYAGDIAKLPASAFNELAKDAASIAMISNQLSVRVLGTDVFGSPEDQVDVLKLQSSSELLGMRRMVERWNASEFPFSPHATIGPPGSAFTLQQSNNVPGYLVFDRIFVGWGNQSLTFWLKRSSY